MAKSPSDKKPARPETSESQAPKTPVERAKRKAEQFKHGFHLAEEALSEAHEAARSADDTVRTGVSVAKKLVAELKRKATIDDDIAAALDLQIDRTIPTEFEPRVVATETKLSRRNVEAVEPASYTVKHATSTGPRRPQRIADGKLEDVQLLGKLRLQIGSEDGTPARHAPYQLRAKLKSATEAVHLRYGKTDIRGYTAVALPNLPVEEIEHIELVFAARAGQSAFTRTLKRTALLAGLTLARPHFVAVPKSLIEKLEEWRATQPDEDAKGTIEDPDEIDLSASPESFGLNEEHIDGNCCLRPRSELPAKEYYFRQTVRLTDIQDTELVFAERKKVARSAVGSPLDFLDESASTYAVLGGNVLVGMSNLYRHAWYPKGRGLGRLLYSTSLAPCEEVNLAFIDWTRSEQDTRSERGAQSERLAHELQHDRSIDEVVDAVVTESQSGSSSSGGGGASLDLGFVSIGGGGGGTSSSTSGRRSLHASTTQYISDSISQNASAIRHQRTTVVTTSRQRESERIQTRTVHNHNMHHIMNLQYFQVVEHYVARTELVEEKPVLLIPYKVDSAIFGDIPSFAKFTFQPSLPITRFLDRHASILRRMVPGRYRRAFDSLSRLLHCRDIYKIEAPYATFSRWDISLASGWRPGVSLSLKTKSGQTIRLRPRGQTAKSPPTSFTSAPVKHQDLESLVVSFDIAEAVRDTAAGGLPEFLEQLLESTATYRVDRVDVHATTDRSRFLSVSQSFAIETAQVGVTLSANNPSVEIAVTKDPEVDFTNYRGREHEDYCLLKELIAHIQRHPMRYMRAIWLREDSDRRAIRFERFKVGNDSLLDLIVNRPVGVQGNYVAFELLDGHRLAPVKNPGYAISSRVVTLPTRGVFGEVFLSCCNATEKRDVERFVEPENRCQRRAPEIAGVSPGSRASRADTTPSPFAAPMVNLQTAPSVPAPTGLPSALSVLGTPDIFRDLSRGAELLAFINNASKEAFTSTRQHRAAMDAIVGDVVRGIVSAYTGAPIKSSGQPQTAQSGTTGIDTTGASTGEGASSLSFPTSAQVNDPALQAVNSELLRQSTPAHVSDHMQAIQRGVETGMLTPDQGRQLTHSLLGGVQDQRLVVPASHSMHSLESEPLGTASRSVDVRLRLFIPAPAVALVPQVGDHYGGDGRTFGYDGGTSRAEVRGTLKFGTDHTWPEFDISKIEFGETKAYEAADTTEVADKPSWWRSVNPGAAVKDSRTLPRSNDNLAAQPSYTFPRFDGGDGPLGPTAAVLYFRIDAANPLATPSPAIDAEIRLELKEYNGKLHVKLAGHHDGFPAYELYVDRCLVYSHDPTGDDSPVDLLPPTDVLVAEGANGGRWFELPCETV